MVLNCSDWPAKKWILPQLPLEPSRELTPDRNFYISAPKMSNNTDPESPSVTERNVKLSFYIVALIIGFVGNSLVVAVIAGKKHKRSVYDLFILNLGISDFSFVVFSMPIFIYDHVKGIYKTVYYCRLVQPLLTIFYFLSIFTIASMAVHRCRLITNPYRPKMRKRIAHIWIAFIWISSFTIVLPLSIVAKVEDGECLENWPSLNHRKAYTLALSILQFLLPLFIIAVAYIRIGIYLWRSTLPQSSLSEVKKKKAQKRRRENIQVIKTLAMIVILFAICLLPGQIAWLLLDFGGQQELEVALVIFKFSDILDCLHACVNPIVYGLLTEQFRREYIRYFSYWFTCGKKQVNTRHETRIAESTVDVLSPVTVRRKLTTSTVDVQIEAAASNPDESHEIKDFNSGMELSSPGSSFLLQDHTTSK